jgi:hypothetical protein
LLVWPLVTTLSLSLLCLTNFVGGALVVVACKDEDER